MHFQMIMMNMNDDAYDVVVLSVANIQYDKARLSLWKCSPDAQ